MKKLISLIIIASIILLTSCGAKTAVKPIELESDTVSSVDEIESTTNKGKSSILLAIGGRFLRRKKENMYICQSPKI